MRDALEGNKFNVYKKMTCQTTLIKVKSAAGKKTARSRRDKSFFDNPLRKVLFPRPNRRGPIEGLSARTAEKLTPTVSTSE
jgi:hypothetical protein